MFNRNGKHGRIITNTSPDRQDCPYALGQAGSPAAKAGLQPQDEIIAVDGQPTTTLTVSKLRKVFRVEGEPLLSIKRGKQIVEAIDGIAQGCCVSGR